MGHFVSWLWVLFYIIMISTAPMIIIVVVNMLAGLGFYLHDLREDIARFFAKKA